jgi:hypothetical protein
MRKHVAIDEEANVDTVELSSFGPYVQFLFGFSHILLPPTTGFAE